MFKVVGREEKAVLEVIYVYLSEYMSFAFLKLTLNASCTKELLAGHENQREKSSMTWGHLGLKLGRFQWHGRTEAFILINAPQTRERQ